MTIATIEEGRLEAFRADNAGKPQLLVFSATWCAPCKAMTPALDDVSDMYDGQVAIGKIDIEAAPELAKAFNVRGVPTLVAVNSGKEVKRLVGGQSKTRLSLLLDEMLDDVDSESTRA